MTALTLVALLAGSEVVPDCFPWRQPAPFSLLSTPTINPLTTQTSTIPPELLQNDRGIGSPTNRYRRGKWLRAGADHDHLPQGGGYHQGEY